ncbi:hypothetical protein [Sphingomonas sp.]|uniref:hypothetical protein n=1 Tax=Sphingomonadales TaxID=204457 RepID=UPI0035C81D74
MFDALVKALTSSFERAPWGWGVFAMLIAGYFRLKPLMVRLKNEREANLLNERAEEMEAMRARVEALEARLERERTRHEAERALDRHRLNNMDQCFNALFLMFETSPEKAAQAIAAVKEMRERQMQSEAIEKATIHAAAIQQTGPAE